jgi:iron complex outermembrane receptor protein
VSGSWRITPGWVVSAGAGRVVTTPTILERYSDRFPAVQFQLSAEFMGNPGLRPEESLELDLGTHATIRGFAFDASLFHRHMDNYITVEADPTLPKRLPLSPPTVYRYINGSARFYGGEASLRRTLGRYVLASGTVSYTWAEDLKLGEPVIGIPPLRGNLELTFHSPGNRHWVRAGAVVVDRQNRVAVSRFETATAGYAIFHVVGVERLTRRWTLQAGVQNIGNRLYTDHLDAVNPYTHLRIPEMGRNFHVGLAFHF